jgi:hypothetical protein
LTAIGRSWQQESSPSPWWRRHLELVRLATVVAAPPQQPQGPLTDLQFDLLWHNAILPNSEGSGMIPRVIQPGVL